MGDISEFLRPKSDENNTETELEKSGNKQKVDMRARKPLKILTS